MSMRDDGTDIVAVISALSALLVAAATGFWQWFTHRRKGKAEAGKIEAEAQTAVMSGFVLLYNQLREEREDLIKRCDRFDIENRWLRRRNHQLETELARNHIRSPEPEDKGKLASTPHTHEEERDG